MCCDSRNRLPGMLRADSESKGPESAVSSDVQLFVGLSVTGSGEGRKLRDGNTLANGFCNTSKKRLGLNHRHLSLFASRRQSEQRWSGSQPRGRPLVALDAEAVALLACCSLCPPNAC